ncbi:MAG: hypothetical protein H8D23_12875 [Candidatus Brocadiales bacterium]|nr:hypothetical protein [Candidatus Brocadiales bacterium]
MAVPVAYEPLVRKFRRFIRDEEDINTLLEAEESTDQLLYDCIVDALEEINWMHEPTTEFTLNQISTDTTGIPWVIVRSGATLQYLTSAGIHSSRNTFTYSDGSGIQVQDSDAYGRYINYYNILIPKYERMVANFKRKKNIEDCYGGQASEYGDLW